MDKQVHFRIDSELWEKFKIVFPYKGEPSAFFRRCMIAAIKHNTSKVDHTTIKEVNPGEHG